MIAPSVANAQVQYRYDTLGRLIQAVSPDGSSVQYGYDAAGNVTAIRRLAAGTLSLIEFTPRMGATGSAVTLYGSGFSPTAAQNTVTFNGTAATVTAASATALSVTVPAGASSGRIAVSNANGSATSAGDYVVTAASSAPSIVSFTPQVGTLGTVVTLTGSGFQESVEDNKVRFGSHASVAVKDASSPTSTSLKTNVPGAAASGKVSLSTPFGTAVSKDDFFAVPSSVNPADVEQRARIVVGGPAVTVTTTAAGKKAVLLFDAQAGHRLHFVSTGGTFANAGNAVLAEVYGGDGSTIGTVWLSNSGVPDFTQAISVDGTYTVVLSPTGPGTLQLALVADQTGNLVVDAADATTVMIAREGQDARYTFSGRAGQLVSVVLSASTLDDGNTSTRNYTYVYLYKPSNSTSYATFGYFDTGTAGTTLDVSLPETGIYTVWVVPSALDKGTVALQVKSFVTGNLAVDSSTAVSLSAGRKARFNFTAEAGKGYGLALTGLGFTPSGGSLVASLRKADGTQLVTCSFSSSNSCDLSPTYFTTSGSYLLDLYPSGIYAANFNLLLSKDAEGVLSVDAAAATTVTIAREGQNANLTFNGTAGQLVSVVLSGSTLDDGNTSTGNYTYVYLYKPSSPAANQVAYRSFYTGVAGTTLDATLPETGTYTVWMSPGALDKGMIAVQVKSFMTGALVVDSSTAVSLSAGRNARFSFAAEAGKGYGLALTNLVFTPSGGSLWAYLRKADGTLLASCNFSVSYSDNCDFGPNLFASSGTYLLDFDPSDLGAASFNAVLSKDAEGVLSVDAATAATVTIAREGQNARYTFSGTAGQSVSVVLKGSTLDDGNTSTSNYTYVYLYKPSSPAASPVTSAGFNTGTAGTALDVLLPETGTYTAWVVPSALDKGTVTMQVKSFTTGVLAVDGATAVSISDGRTARFSFTATAGKGYGLALTGLGFTPSGASLTAYLRTAGGNLLADCNFSSSGSCDFSPALFTTSGTYLLDFDTPGLYAATFNAVLSKDVEGVLTVDAAAATTVTIAREGQNARYTFSGTAGQLVSVVLSGNTLDDGSTSTSNYTYVYLYKPSSPAASPVTSGTFWNTGATGTLDVTLPETGTYTVWMAPAALDKGTITMQVKSFVTGALAVDSSTAVSLSAGRKARFSFTAVAGKGYGFALTNMAFTPSGSWLTGYLRKADGTELASCRSFSTSSYSDCNFLPSYFATDGTYLLDLVPPGLDASTFDAVLSKDVEGTLTIDAAAATTVTIARAGQNARYAFSGTAGQLVSVVFSNNTLDDGNTSTTSNTLIYLYKPSSPAANEVILGVSTGTASKTLDVTLPETGTYTVWVTPSALEKGTFALQVKRK